jgi:hypothetical protein
MPSSVENYLVLLDEDTLVIAPNGLLHMELLCLYSCKDALLLFVRRFFLTLTLLWENVSI